MILKNNNLKLGIILALLLPLIVVLIIYFLRFSYYPFPDFFKTVLQESRLITFISVWCLVANIALFTVYINSNLYQTAKGVFIVTVAYGLGFLLLKLFM